VQEDHKDFIIIIAILITKIQLGVGCVVVGRRKTRRKFVDEHDDDDDDHDSSFAPYKTMHDFVIKVSGSFASQEEDDDVYNDDSSDKCDHSSSKI